MKTEQNRSKVFALFLRAAVSRLRKSEAPEHERRNALESIEEVAAQLEELSGQVSPEVTE
ncbi:hypothetical protein D3C83_181490 [compost metagenome]